jgi:EAL domain-containing protein (putative c-di-GMP-specific phosphodiesterase class I)
MESPVPAVLVADDDPQTLLLFTRVLTEQGYRVTSVSDGDTALRALEAGPFDLVLTDIDMPGRSGIELLRAIRTRALDLPVILVTGDARLETALSAIDYGATKYLTKPVTTRLLRDTVALALRAGQLARARRELTSLSEVAQTQVSDLAALESRFDGAIASAYLDYQPIVSWSGQSTFAYEALVRSHEPDIAYPDALFDAADRLGRTAHLGHRVRELCAASSASAGPAVLFINVHPIELLDERLYEVKGPLAAMASRVVLEITERARLETVPDASRRIRTLREMGFRIAIDDIGAGYAGLTSFAVLDPHFMKLDRALVSNIEQSRTKLKLVEAMIRACHDLGVQVIGEGIETADERNAIVSLGCDLLQGYLFGRPAPTYAAPQF